MDKGADITLDYAVMKSIERLKRRTLTVINTDGEVFEFDYTKRINRDKGDKIILKDG
jgi:hypothetical protein